MTRVDSAIPSTADPAPGPPTPPSDHEVLRAFVSGVSEALGELAHRHEQDLLGLASGLLNGRRDLARDAVQEVWVRVIRYGHRFRGDAEVRTWLYRLTVNCCHDVRKQRARRPQPPATEDARAHEPKLDAVRAAVETLEPRLREVVLLSYHRDLTQEQVASILNIPLGTVKSRRHAAIRELRAALAIEESS